MALSDKERFAIIQGGDQSAFEAVFREHYAALCGFARRLVDDPAVSEELVQDLFVQLWEKRETLSLETSLRSYLFTATRNSCLNHLKHLQVRVRHEDHVKLQALPLADDPSEVLQAAELQARLRLAIDELPDRCGEIFKMSRFEGLKYDEIAERLNLSPRTVEVQIGKALRLLREALADWLPMLIACLGWEYFF